MHSAGTQEHQKGEAEELVVCGMPPLPVDGRKGMGAGISHQEMELAEEVERMNEFLRAVAFVVGVALMYVLASVVSSAVSWAFDWPWTLKTPIGYMVIWTVLWATTRLEIFTDDDDE